ncbi:hypothetical protein AB0C29_14725 [Actinoplanes sp. NPDC048791]|uniref:hypothetical protein n=1 Tax=Actinoplanes sp. NPDC048791 TaxID=3154623 RepID=UPI0033C0729D
MDAMFVLVFESVTLAGVERSLAAQGVQVQHRSEDRGGEYLLCRLGDGPAWEVSLEAPDSPSFAELEGPDLDHIRRLRPAAVLLIAFRTSSWEAIHEVLRNVEWHRSARYLAGDGTGVSVSVG